MTQTAARLLNPQDQRARLFRRAEDYDLDLRTLLLMLWRRKMVVVGCILIGLSFSTILMSFMKPQYTSRALLLIENRISQNGIEEIQSLLSSSFRMDPSFILSEIEVIKSRTTALKVVKKLNLMADPEFNPRFQYTVSANNSNSAGDTEFKKLSVYGSELENLPAGMVEKDVGDVITAFLNNLAVRSIPGSNAIQIEYTSSDRNKAALIANTVIDAYIEQRLENKFLATKKVTDWLDQRLEVLRTQVQEADRAIAQYKKQYNLAEGARNVSISAEQLSALNAQLITAKARKAEAQARLKQLKDMAGNIEKVEVIPEIINSPLIQKLKSDRIDLKGQLSELSRRYGPKHPTLLKLQTQMDGLNEQLRAEMLKISKSTENEVLFADASIKALEEGLTENQGQQFVDNQAIVGLNDLEREAESTRLIYETFLKTYKETDDREKLQSPEARVISSAVPARSPSFPNKLLILSLATVMSTFIGLVIAFLLEKMDNTFRSIHQIESLSGYPCFALVPKVEDATAQELTNYVLSKPSSMVAESVRTLRTVLNLRPSSSGSKTRCVTLTSSFPGEGKTILSLWLGRLAAKSGERVIIIDADLRRSGLHKALGVSNDSALVDYLTGQKTLSQIIHKNDVSGVHMIYGRSVPNSALDLLNSDKMAQLIEELKDSYDLIVIDSPACMAVSDACVLAKMSNRLIYLVAWDQTPREVVLSGIKQFSDMQYDDVAVVLSQVDIKRHVKYGFGDSAYYLDQYKEYYVD